MRIQSLDFKSIKKQENTNILDTRKIVKDELAELKINDPEIDLRKEGYEALIEKAEKEINKTNDTERIEKLKNLIKDLEFRITKISPEGNINELHLN